jgi:hypothetical protein
MINISKIKVFLFSLLLTFSFFAVNTAYCADKVVTPVKKDNLGTWQDKLTTGAETSGPYKDAPGINKNEKLIKYIGAILDLVALFGYLLIVRIVWAGYLWMTAGGEAEKVEDAKKVISHSVIGIVILVALYAISYFVVDALQKVSGYIG